MRLSSTFRIPPFAITMVLLLCLSLFTACRLGGRNSHPVRSSVAPASTPSVCFDADSAYQFAARQMAFGPRVPGAPAHDSCAAWLVSTLERFSSRVQVHQATVTAYDGTTLTASNIFASFRPEAQERVLLLSHWDSRPMADEDARPERRKEAVPAANDGASGVAVLLEVARLAHLAAPALGVDILLVDVEDYGAPDDWRGPHRETDWALGTQAWARQARSDGYQPRYAILLDMVGAPDATFYREYFSDRFAPHVVDLVWSTAQQLGYGSLFINQSGPAITDDHVFVNRLARIPTIDIIDTRQHEGRSFYPYWHTTEDTLDKLSVETLRQVGQVLVQLIY